MGTLSACDRTLVEQRHTGANTVIKFTEIEAPPENLVGLANRGEYIPPALSEKWQNGFGNSPVVTSLAVRLD